MRSPFDMRSWELQTFPSLQNTKPFQDLLRDSHKFLVGDAAWQICWEFGNELISKRIFKLPFDKVLLEFYDETPRRVTLVVFNGERTDDIVVIPFIRDENSVWEGGIEYTLILDQKGDNITWLHQEAYNNHNSFFFSQQQFLTDLLTSTVAMFSMKDVEHTLVEVSNRLHKARLNKLPLYEYKFVELTTKHYDKIYKGGTHASPALHWRRGHFRHLPDKIVPVAPCLVGSITNGIVEKAYDARPLNNAMMSF